MTTPKLYISHMAIKKTELKVDIFSDELKRKTLKAVSKLEGIDELSVDGEKLIVVGEVDPCLIIKKLKKAGRSAQILSVGPPKQSETDTKVDKPGNNNPVENINPPCPCPAVILDYYDCYEPDYHGGFGWCVIF